MGRPPGRQNIRSLLASGELSRLGVNPIEEALKCIEQLDELIDMNISAFKQMRGYGDRDPGANYLANAIKATVDKKDTYMALSKFVYPTLSAIAVKDISSAGESKTPMNTAEAVKILQNDPFAPESLRSVNTEDIVDSINSIREKPELPIGEIAGFSNSKNDT